MFDQSNPYAVNAVPVDQRAEFIRKTYLHVAGALGVFAILLAFLLKIPAAVTFADKMTQGYNWFIVLGAFMAVSWICLLYTSPSPRDQRGPRMPSSA